MNGPELTKQAAAAELQARASLGRQLLARPITEEAELESVTSARVEWTLGNKKLLHEIFGDAAGQMRSSHGAAGGGLPLRPQLADHVRAFQSLVIEQIADLEKLIVALKRMG